LTPDPTTEHPAETPEPEKKFDENWARLTPRQRRGFVMQQIRRQERQKRRAAFKAIQGVTAPGTTGYCCPKCHRWFTTTEERAACRASHPRKESTT
jgi:hypothetical protein